MDGDVDNDPLFYDNFGHTGNYYLYALVATIFVGLPLLFVAFYKVYTDHQYHRDEQLAHKEKMNEYREAKQGLAADLRSEANSVHARYEMEKMEREQKERQLRLGHGKQVRELESQIRAQERQLNAKNAELEEMIAENHEMQGKHSQQVQQLNNTIAALQTTCRSLRNELEGESEKVNQEREKYERLNAACRRERVERDEREYVLKDQIRVIEDTRRSLQRETERLKSELQRATQRNWRLWRTRPNATNTSPGFQTVEIVEESLFD